MTASTFAARLMSKALAAALVCPVAALATPSTAFAAAPAQSDDAALEEARALFERGRSKYDTFDYEGAIDLWQQAYSKVPESQAGVRNAMVYNIALAQEKAFEVDKDVAHLRQAVLLLESWVASYKALFKRTPETEAEVGKAEARIAELEARIEAIEGGAATDESPDTTGAGEDIAFDTGYTPPPEVMREREKAEAANRTEGLIAAGWTVGGIGGLVLLSGLAGLAAVTATDGNDGLGASIGVTVVGAGMVATGGVLLGKGYKRKRAEQGKYSFAPYFDRRGGGAAFSMRF